MEARYMPQSIIYFMNSSIGKLISICLIIFIATRDIENSKLSALFLMTIFLVILHYSSEKQIREEYYNFEYNNTNLLKQVETFKNKQPLCDLNIKNNKDVCNSHIPPVIEDEEGL